MALGREYPIHTFAHGCPSALFPMSLNLLGNSFLKAQLRHHLLSNGRLSFPLAGLSAFPLYFVLIIITAPIVV